MYYQGDIDLSILFEESFRKPKGETAKDDKIDAIRPTFPLNPIPGAFDIPEPMRRKEKFYGIGSGHNPSKIINKMAEPTNYTVNAELVNPVFLAYALGKLVTSAGDVAEISTITCVANVASSLNDKYFFFDVIEDSDTGTVKKYYIWFDANSAGSDPALGAPFTACECDLTTDDTAAEVATALAAAINAKANLTDDTTAAAVTTVVTCTNAWKGAVDNLHDSATATATGFAFAVSTEGLSIYTFGQPTNHQIQTFTLHCEQRNAVSGDNYVWDMLGSFISEYEIAMAYADNTIKEVANITTAKSVAGNAATYPPAEFSQDIMDWAHMDESTTEVAYNSANILPMASDVGETDKISFKIINKILNLPTIGDANVNMAVLGVQEFEITFHAWIMNDDLYNLWKELYSNATNGFANGQITFTLKIMRSATDYVTLTLTGLFVEDFTCHYQSIEEVIKGVDIVLKDASNFSLTGSAKSSISQEHFHFT